MNNLVKFRRLRAMCKTPQKLELRSFPHQPDGKSDKPKMTIENVEHLLKSYGIRACYNVISKRVELIEVSHEEETNVPTHNQIASSTNASFTKVLSLAGLNNMATGLVAEMVSAIGEQNEYNPAKKWIESRPWDGVDRLKAYYGTLETPKDYSIELKETLMYKWLLSATAAALKESGFYTRGVLTMQGVQYKGKTNWLRSLVNDPKLQSQLIRTDHQIDANNKDSILGAAAYWLVELGELDSSFKKDIARIKGFISSDRDRVRRPYDRFESDFPRRTVFCATVNESSFLVDTTGNTRWWTIPILNIHFDHGIDTQQLFAQMAVDFANGEQWWLTDEENKMLEQCNQQYRAVSKIRDKIHEFVDIKATPSGKDQLVTATTLLEHMGIKSPTNGECRECGSILREYFGSDVIRAGAKAWRVPMVRGKQFDVSDETLGHLEVKDDSAVNDKANDEWDDLPF